MTPVCRPRRDDAGDTPHGSVGVHAAGSASGICRELLPRPVVALPEAILEWLRRFDACGEDGADGADRQCQAPTIPHGVRMAAVERVSEHDLRQILAALRARFAPAGTGTLVRGSARIPMSIGRRTHLVSRDSIDAVIAQRNYVDVHAGGRTYTLRSSLYSFERRLDPDRFLRVHRSTIVRIGAIDEIGTLGSGRCRIVLQGGLSLSSARRYRARLLELLDEERGVRGAGSAAQTDFKTHGGAFNR
ncbi:LytTR family DNA-binding domain-containing protein [Dokdonella immobilis]|uniref:LytTr DNA-binding domain-containing protein n=1 Tax=Dokdonella immobilis TaxID=578942 RepID=A0A1I4ZML0_9GAMM|nr:LytTR family DNA-binding domain-containing protein [Dokdonella immobilis]SFN51462.1 LytTr DNA-binding domain-containing protein [Dokdonella immobilis]